MFSLVVFLFAACTRQLDSDAAFRAKIVGTWTTADVRLPDNAQVKNLSSTFNADGSWISRYTVIRSSVSRTQATMGMWRIENGMMIELQTNVARQPPGGEVSIFPPGGKSITEKLGITGLAPGPDGSLYIAQPNAVLKLKMDGTFTTIAGSIELKDCDVDYADHNPNNPTMPLPCLRGLAVDENGTVFAAGVGCHAVVKVRPDGKAETVLKAERPWSPTGVAVHRRDVYVLEYTNANGGQAEGWRPRVRKLARDGKVMTLFTAPAEP